VDLDRPELQREHARDRGNSRQTQTVDANDQLSGARRATRAERFGPESASGERAGPARLKSGLQSEQKLVREEDAKRPEPAQGRHSLITRSSSAPPGRG